MKAINIKWDIDTDEYDENLGLPTEIEIPAGMTDEEEISDYLSDETGFCHCGFELVEMQNIVISKKKMDMINDLLDLTGDEIYQKYGLKRDETIVNTAKFPNGIEVDIKVVICDGDDTPYTEGIMFHNGSEVSFIDGENGYDGEWWFKYDGVQYLVNVVAEE